MARMTTTTSAVFIPEIWENEVKAEYEENLVLGGRCKLFNHRGKPGDVLHVPDVSNLDANDMTENGEVTAQAITESETQITIDKHKEASFRLADLARMQALHNLRREYTGKCGFAIAKAVEQSIMALGVGASVQQYDADGTAASPSGGTINVAGILRAIQDLDDGNVPDRDRVMIVNPAARNDMLQIQQFTSMEYVNMKPTEKAKIGEIFGLDVLVSNLLPTDSNSKTNALVFQRDAFALAMQQDPRTQADYEQAKLSWLVTVDVIYGVKLFRADNVVGLVLSA